LAFGAIDAEHVGIEAELAAKPFVFGNVGVFHQRQHERDLSRDIGRPQTLEEITGDRGAAAAVYALEEQIGIEPVLLVDVVAAKIGVVRRQLNVVTRAPGVIERNAARSEQMALPLVLARRRVGIVGEAALQPHAAIAAPAVTILALEDAT